MRLSSFGLISSSFFVAFVVGCGVTRFPPSPEELTIASTISSGTVNVAYNAMLTASGGTSPYNWSVTAGTLPKGLSMSNSGVLSGMPTVAGSSTVTFQVRDSESIPSKASTTATIMISDGTVSITTASPLTQGKLNSAYISTLAASGGTAPYTWTITSGSLPAGVTLSTGGVISGTPTAYGSNSFIVQATDSAPTPQSATAPMVLQISGGALTISTASLPAGTEGVAYSSQLAAAGGVPPYSWTLSPTVPLAAGLTLTSSGLLAGTPTGVSNTTPIFTVVDSAGDGASAGLNLLVQSAPAPVPDGYYAFVFGGTSPQGTPIAPNAIAINGTFTVRGGTVLSGFYDANTNSGPTLIEQPITGGTLTASANGLGTLVLKAGTASTTLALAIPPSAAPGKDSAIRIIEFDDADGNGTRGSGVLKPALPNPTTAAIQGNFAFLLSGSDLNQNEQALIGSFQTDGQGNIIGGLADSNQAGATYAFQRVNGTYSVDANGRGVFQFVLGPGPIEDNIMFHYSFYQVSPGEWLTISLDPATLNSPLVGGSVIQQKTGPFNNASLTGTSVLELSGLAPTTGGIVPDITLGLATSNGNGNLSASFDEYNGTLNTGRSAAYTYSVDPTTGRIPTASSSGQGPTLYLIDGTRAFVLGSDGSSSSGLLELQSGSPFTNASFSGNYLGGSLPLINTSVLNEAGIVAADGNGNVLFTTNRSGPQGLAQYQNVSGTYAVDGTGGVVVTTPDAVTRIFYVVSPTKVAYLTSDGGGYLGSFEQ
jgi:Putative Ig domain